MRKTRGGQRVSSHGIVIETSGTQLRAAVRVSSRRMTALDLYNHFGLALAAMRFFWAQGESPHVSGELIPRVDIRFLCVLNPANSKDAPCPRLDSTMP